MAGKAQKAKAVATKIVHVGKKALADTREQLARARAATANLRKNMGGKGGGMLTTLEVVGGGGAAGAAKVYMPEVMGIDTRLIAGAVGVLGGLFAPISPKISGHIMAVSSGILAGYTQDVVEDLLDGDEAAAE
jgi:hypothetical protein